MSFVCAAAIRYNRKQERQREGTETMNFHQLHIFTRWPSGEFFRCCPSASYEPAGRDDAGAGAGGVLWDKAAHPLHQAHGVIRGREDAASLARKSLELSQETDAAMAAFSNKLQGRLQLGASLTIGEYVLPRLLGPFGREYPDISIMLKVMNTTQILEEIASHQLNFGLIEAPVEHPDMVLDAVMEDELKLIVPSSHPLAQREDAIYLKDVLTYPFVLREKGSGTRKVMEDVLLERGHDPESIQTVMELGSTGAVKSAVEEGLGITMLSTSTVKHETALGLVKMIDIADASFKRNFYSIHLRSALLPMSAMTFLAYLRERRR